MERLISLLVCGLLLQTNIVAQKDTIKSSYDRMDIYARCENLSETSFEIDKSQIDSYYVKRGAIFNQLRISSNYPSDTLPSIFRTIHTTSYLSIWRDMKFNEALLAQNDITCTLEYIDSRNKVMDTGFGQFKKVRLMRIAYYKGQYFNLDIFSTCDSLVDLSILEFERMPYAASQQVFTLPKRLISLFVPPSMYLTAENIPCFAKSNVEILTISLSHRKKIPKNIGELANIKDLRIRIGGDKKISKRRSKKIYEKLKVSLPNLIWYYRGYTQNTIKT